MSADPPSLSAMARLDDGADTHDDFLLSLH